MYSIKDPDSEENVEYVHPVNALSSNKKIKSEVPVEEGLENLKLNQPYPNQTQPQRDSMAQVLIQIKDPDSEENVEYVHPVNALSSNKKIKSEVPVEEGLENLKLNQPYPNQTQPQRDSMAQVLIQGLHNNNKHVVQNVLFRHDVNIINDTVIMLPNEVVVPLVKELTTLVQGKTHMSQIAAYWLKVVLTVHADQLANLDLTETFSHLLSLVETKLGLLAPLLRLRGRLDLLVDQISTSSETLEANRDPEESLLVYPDAESPDEVGDVEEAVNNNCDSDEQDELSDEELESENESEIQDEVMDAAEN